MKVDKRTFIIVAIIVAIAVPIIILAFRKSFIPIIVSFRQSFSSAALTNGTTGAPKWLINQFK